MKYYEYYYVPFPECQKYEEFEGNEPIDKWFKSKGKHKLGFTKNA